MSFGDIERVYVWDHRMLRRVEFPLGRFTVLVGQNDTGKSTVLDALEDLLTGRAGVGEESACVGWMPAPGAVRPVPGNRYVFRGYAPRGPGRPSIVEDRRVDRYVVYNRECSQVVDTLDRRVDPDVECVRLDLGDRTTAHEIVANYLRRLARALRSAADDDPSSRWRGEAADLRLFYQRTDPAAMPWALRGLSKLEDETYKLLPGFVRRSYEKVVINVDTSAADDALTRSLLDEEAPGAPARLWFARVSLKGLARDEPLDFDRLASGVRPWLLAALHEQSRRLLGGRVRLVPGDEDPRFEFEDRPPAQRCLYLVDEPERHLHPTAQVEVARWLHAELTGERSGVVIATHAPAFLDLPPAGVRVVKCWAVDEDGGRRARLLELPSGDRAELVRMLADSGLRQADLFLTGTVPILVEGKGDRAYVRAAWQSLFKEVPEAAGVHVLQCGGEGQIGERWSLLNELYPPDTTFCVLVDCGKNDAAHRAVDRIVAGERRVTKKFVLDVGDVTFAAPEWRVRGMRNAPSFEHGRDAWRSSDRVGKESFTDEVVKVVLEAAENVHPTVADMLMQLAGESLRRPAASSRCRPPVDRQQVARRLGVDVDEVLTIEEAARRLGIGKDEVLRRIASSADRGSRNALVAWRCGWRWWVLREDLAGPTAPGTG